MNKTMSNPINNPLNTIFKSKNKSKLKTLLETQIRPFQNNEINRIQARYQNVFSQIMSIFSESKFCPLMFNKLIKKSILKSSLTIIQIYTFINKI